MTTYSDSFDRADSASLGNLDTGQAWSEPIGTGTSIVSNRAQSVATANNMAIFTSDGADGTVSCDVIATGSMRCGLSFRYVDTNNFWRCQRNSDGTVLIVRNVAGTFTNFSSSTQVVSGDRLRLVMVGTSIRAYVNSTRSHDLTDSNHSTAVKHGIVTIENGAAVDNFQFISGEVQTLPASTSAAGSTLAATAPVGVPAGTVTATGAAQAPTAGVGQLAGLATTAAAVNGGSIATTFTAGAAAIATSSLAPSALVAAPAGTLTAAASASAPLSGAGNVAGAVESVVYTTHAPFPKGFRISRLANWPHTPPLDRNWRD